MKKHYLKIAVMALVLVFTQASTNVLAQDKPSKQEKTLAKKEGKDYKKAVKALRKKGFDILGSSQTFEVAFLAHKVKLEKNPQLVERVATISKCKSYDICKSRALNQVQKEYTSLISAQMDGLTTDQIAVIDEDTEQSTFTQTFTTKARAAVGGLFSPDFSIVRDNGDGTKEFRTYYIFDKSKSQELIQKALEQSLKNAKLTVEIANTINEAVEKEFAPVLAPDEEDIDEQ